MIHASFTIGPVHVGATLRNGAAVEVIVECPGARWRVIVCAPPRQPRRMPWHWHGSKGGGAWCVAFSACVKRPAVVREPRPADCAPVCVRTDCTRCNN